jgi:hypothetical protein
MSNTDTDPSKNAGRKRLGPTLTFPQLNLNGTSSNELLAQYHDAIVALELACAAVRKAWPHGRDYQTLDNEAHRTAMFQHTVRLERIVATQRELEDIYEAIHKQVEERRK